MSFVEQDSIIGTIFNIFAFGNRETHLRTSADLRKPYYPANAFERIDGVEDG